jgi:hypothetical protein
MPPRCVSVHSRLPALRYCRISVSRACLTPSSSHLSCTSRSTFVLSDQRSRLPGERPVLPHHPLVPLPAEAPPCISMFPSGARPREQAAAPATSSPSSPWTSCGSDCCSGFRLHLDGSTSPRAAGPWSSSPFLSECIHERVVLIVSRAACFKSSVCLECRRLYLPRPLLPSSPMLQRRPPLCLTAPHRLPCRSHLHARRQAAAVPLSAAAFPSSIYARVHAA